MAEKRKATTAVAAATVAEVGSDMLSTPIVPHNGNSATPEERKARETIRALLKGDPAPYTPEECGPWREVVAELVRASQNGLEATRNAWHALASQHHELIVLISATTERKTSWTGRELLEAEFPEPTWIVPGLLPSGLTILAGRPKVGKSWLALQIAVAVATGGRVFNEHIEKGSVLYLALEDSPRRLQQRLKDLNAPPLDHLRFETAWTDLTDGGLTDLVMAVQKMTPRLIVIDTLARSARIDHNDVNQTTTILSNLQTIAQEGDCAVLVVDHHTKARTYSNDPIDDILGSTGKSAAVDTAMGLYRERGKAEATLKIVGRDIEERELVLRWDVTTHAWQLVGDAAGVRKESLQAQILETVRALEEAEELPTPTAIADTLKRDKGNIARELAELVNKGLLRKGEKVGRKQPYYTVNPQHEPSQQ